MFVQLRGAGCKREDKRGNAPVHPERNGLPQTGRRDALAGSNGNLALGPVSLRGTGYRWNIVNNYLTLTLEVCYTSIWDSLKISEIQM